MPEDGLGVMRNTVWQERDWKEVRAEKVRGHKAFVDCCKNLEFYLDGNKNKNKEWPCSSVGIFVFFKNYSSLEL